MIEQVVVGPAGVSLVVGGAGPVAAHRHAVSTTAGVSALPFELVARHDTRRVPALANQDPTGGLHPIHWDWQASPTGADRPIGVVAVGDHP